MTTRLTILILSTALSAIAVDAADTATQFDSGQYGFVRLFQKAKQDPKWQEADLLTDRMWLVRSYAAKESVVSDPVSDRYAVTCYGGPIDLVHFFCLSADICSGDHTIGKRLYKEWVAEGGRENLLGFDYSQPPEAHPDDLPSNAFGALFGWEIRGHQPDLDFDLEAAFSRFIAPLLPLPDAVAKQFSHRAIVMGLPKRASREQREERYGWFTAAPLVLCAEINRVAIRVQGEPLCRSVSDGEAALALAGFRIHRYKDRPIIIRRAGAPRSR